MAEHRHAQTIRRYFAACNQADYDKLVSCFTPDAVHYFLDGLPDIPWRTAHTIARKWQWCLENLGSQWTIEKILVSHDSDEAVIEWTHCKSKLGTALRGDE
jgi:ketosteroid isomerase-like protein